MPIQLIIFDFDGTLSDTRQTIVSTFQATIHQLDLPPMTDEACAATIGLPLKDCFLQLYPLLDEATAEICVQTYRRIFEEQKQKLAPRLFPHVRETLRSLHQQHISLTIASSRSERSLHEFIEEMGLKDLFSCVLGADSVAKAKPDPTPVLQTWKEVPVAASDTLVVGDMPVDIWMGKGAGAWTCGVTYGNATAEELQAAGADYLVSDFAEILNLVK